MLFACVQLQVWIFDLSAMCSSSSFTAEISFNGLLYPFLIVCSLTYVIARMLMQRRWSLDDMTTAYVALQEAQAHGNVQRALDIGCGIGSVLMMVAWGLPHVRATGIEAQERSVQLARRSIKYNGADDRVKVGTGAKGVVEPGAAPATTLLLRGAIHLCPFCMSTGSLGDDNISIIFIDALNICVMHNGPHLMTHSWTPVHNHTNSTLPQLYSVRAHSSRFHQHHALLMRHSTIAYHRSFIGAGAC